MPGSKQCDASDGPVRSVCVGDLKPVALLEILNDIRTFIKRFCVFPNDHCLNAVTLWVAHAHIIKHLYITARLAVISPELASGKTRVLEILNTLVPLPEFSFNASPAAIFRLLAEEQITLLFDEADTIWSKRGKDDTNEDLRALLNAGYKRGASIPRCTGKNYEVTRFKVYCAVALAGIGNLPETIMSRSVIINMRRRAPDEKVEPFYWRIHEPEGHKLRDRLAEWAESVGAEIGSYIPKMAEGIIDRPAEVWEPLLTVADNAGGDWPQIARDACKALCKSALDTKTTLGVRLLSDMKKIFRDELDLKTAEVIRLLTTDNERLKPLLDDDAPWPELYGKPINSRTLSKYLKPYGIKPTKIRFGSGKNDTFQGYRAEDLHDAWKRYVPPPPAEAEQAEHPEQVSSGAGSSVPDKSSVPDRSGTSGNGKNGESSEMFRQQTEHATKTEHSNPYGVRDVPDVPDVPDLRTPMAEGSEYDNSGTEEVVV